MTCFDHLFLLFITPIFAAITRLGSGILHHSFFPTPNVFLVFYFAPNILKRIQSSKFSISSSFHFNSRYFSIETFQYIEQSLAKSKYTYHSVDINEVESNLVLEYWRLRNHFIRVVSFSHFSSKKNTLLPKQKAKMKATLFFPKFFLIALRWGFLFEEWYGGKKILRPNSKNFVID